MKTNYKIFLRIIIVIIYVFTNFNSFGQLKYGKYVNINETLIFRKDSIFYESKFEKANTINQNDQIIIKSAPHCITTIDSLQDIYKITYCSKVCTSTHFFYLIEEYDEKNEIISRRKYRFFFSNFNKNGFEYKKIDDSHIKKTLYLNGRRIYSRIVKYKNDKKY